MGAPKGRVGRALVWIEGVLDRLDVPRQYVGGLAARAHGATRPLRDIDLYVPDEALPRIADAMSAYLLRHPVTYEDDDWSLVFLRAEYQGQAVEVAGSDSARYFDNGAGEWRDVEVDYDAGIPTEIEGVEVPVMPADALAAYKSALDREVDREDLEQMDGGTPDDAAAS